MKNFSSHFPQQNPTKPDESLKTLHTRQGEENGERGPPPPPKYVIDDERDRKEKARCEWNFNLSAVISSADGASDVIGAVEFDHSNSLFATGGIARKIRIYAAEKVTGFAGEFLDHATACEFYICTPAKLSSLKWRSGSGSRIIGSGDYDGVVMEHDLEKRVPVFERDEHGGRRVWSIDYSHCDSAVGASASDDGTMQMWDTRCDEASSIADVRPDPFAGSPVCSVEFDPFGGNLLIVGCADRKIYVYDSRKMAGPLLVLEGHEKAVTYTRFLDPKTIVSSSVDWCLKMWRTEDDRPIRTYKGHVNSRRFVGLSVWRNGGLLSCGSEDNNVYVYDKRWSDPVWVRGFEPSSPARIGGDFVSGVCWGQGGEDRCTIVAGGSDGVLQVYEGVTKSQLVG